MYYECVQCKTMSSVPRRRRILRLLHPEIELNTNRQSNVICHYIAISINGDIKCWIYGCVWSWPWPWRWPMKFIFIHLPCVDMCTNIEQSTEITMFIIIITHGVWCWYANSNIFYSHFIAKQCICLVSGIRMLEPQYSFALVCTLCYNCIVDIVHWSIYL